MGNNTLSMFKPNDYSKQQMYPNVSTSQYTGITFQFVLLGFRVADLVLTGHKVIPNTIISRYV